MESAWTTSIVLLVAFVYSHFYNTRRTEYSSYGLWNKVFGMLIPKGHSAKLLGRLEDFVAVMPQYELYWSPLDAGLASPGTSMDTKPDSSADALLADFAIVLLQPDMRRTFADLRPIATFWRKLLTVTGVQRFLDLAKTCTRSAYVLAVGEIKRPPSRSAKIHIWAETFDMVMLAARRQALTQSIYSLRSLRYKNDYGMFLFACSGEWFSLRWLDLAEAELEILDLEEFNRWLVVVKKQLKERYETEQLLQRKYQLFHRLPRDNDPTAHSRRLRIRKLRSLDAEKLEKRLLELTPPYKDEDLEDHHLLTATDIEFAEHPTYLQQLPIDPIDKKKHLNDWTRPMRLGSPVADMYLKYVQQELKATINKVCPIPASPDDA